MRFRVKVCSNSLSRAMKVSLIATINRSLCRVAAIVSVDRNALIPMIRRV